MAHFGFAVEQALHYLFRLGAPDEKVCPSSRDVADFYQLSGSVAAKLFTRLEKAGIVTASEGREGGFTLARPLAQISVLQVVDAIEGRKRLFECRNIRSQCAIFGNEPPQWANTGVCAIHAAMIEAENRMRESLASVSLQDIAGRAAESIPGEFRGQASQWFDGRRKQRRQRRKVSGPDQPKPSARKENGS